MYGIGQLARASGLTVSALRFYDRAGVLVPAMVDPQTGYRWYAADQVQPARLLAGLRRVGMPLAEIAMVLRRRSDPAAVRLLLDAHLRRLEDGLADARRELSRVHALIDREESPVTVTATRTSLTVACADLAAALGAVRFAASTDPDLPVLHGVLFEVADAALRLVATDRYRLAVSAAPATAVTGPPASALAPATFLDEAPDLLAGAGAATLTLGADEISLEAAGRRLRGQPLDHDFPDYRRLLRGQGPHRVPVDVAALRQSLLTGAAHSVVREQDGARYDATVLVLDADGGLTITPADAPPAGERLRLAVNREFLLEALAAPRRGQLTLELDGPITPLAIRIPDDDRTFSILMPTRLP
jgi:DNA polymerase III sliding clamp (beta) subunit (PCNA family)